MATLVRWDPFREVAAVHNELSRLMNGLFEGNGRADQSWVPTMDVWETDEAIVLVRRGTDVAGRRHDRRAD